MKKSLIILSSILFISCGMPKEKNALMFSTSDPYFDKYKQEFSHEHLRFKQYGIDTTKVNINFVEEVPSPNNEDWIGVCVQQGSKREILIKRSAYFNKNMKENALKFYRKSLLFHELGHCLINRGHNDSQIGFVPISLMNPRIVNGSLVSQYWDSYLDELFLKRNAFYFLTQANLIEFTDSIISPKSYGAKDCRSHH